MTNDNIENSKFILTSKDGKMTTAEWEWTKIQLLKIYAEEFRDAAILLKLEIKDFQVSASNLIKKGSISPHLQAAIDAYKLSILKND